MSNQPINNEQLYVSWAEQYVKEGPAMKMDMLFEVCIQTNRRIDDLTNQISAALEQYGAALNSIAQQVQKPEEKKSSLILPR